MYGIEWTVRSALRVEDSQLLGEVGSEQRSPLRFWKGMLPT